MKKKVLVIHGPNINLTGMREPGVYGKESIDDINYQIRECAEHLNFTVEIVQSNHEGVIIDKIHEAIQNTDGIVINAGAFTHYSYAIRDAIEAYKKPCIEVHFSNIYKREEFRNKSVIAPVCAGHIAGLGKYSYILALEGLKALL